LSPGRSVLEQGQSCSWRATRPSFARLLEGNSIRSTERITGLHRDTILRLLVLAGERCEKFLGKALVNVPVTDGQCDEIWGYVFKKEAHKTPLEAHNKGIGDAYCFVAIKRNTKHLLNFTLARATRSVPTLSSRGCVIPAIGRSENLYILPPLSSPINVATIASLEFTRSDSLPRKVHLVSVLYRMRT
jgi:hypothetical protein